MAIANARKKDKNLLKATNKLDFRVYSILSKAKTIRKLTELGEPDVFTAYREKWDAAAAVIVPLVRQAQTANGIKPYTPEEYADHGAGTEGQP